MTNEELILQRLDALEAKLTPLIKDRQKWTEFKDDLIPLQNHAVALFIEQLQEVEAGFQLEDALTLVKRSMRSIKNFLFILKATDNIIDFVTDLEPLLKSAVPKMIEHLDELERKGVFRIVKSMLDIRAKIAAAYDHHDIEQIGDGLVALLALAKKMADPRTLAFLEKMAEIPASLDLSQAPKVGPFGLISAGFNPEVKEGLGVLMALTKAMAKLKTDGHVPDKVVRPAEIAS
ncbi:MAG: DUF1641 domain-containing protein [Desulfobacteraceae bacterium]|nr:MAG: DUF1641 domain-containing protein [Desulfobacteraceae bacterium]